MYKRISITVLCLGMVVLFGSSLSFGQTVTNTTTSTQTTKNTITKTPVKRAYVRPAAPKVETTETTVVTSTPAVARPIYDQAALKKLHKSLCVEGYDAKVGNANKNVCSGEANAPDLAYSCVWKKKGEGAYAPTLQGPCNLDFAEHVGTIVITKADYKSSPPLSYGSKAECCFRAAKGPAVMATTSSIATTPVKK